MAYGLGLQELESGKINVRLSGKFDEDESNLKVSYDGYDVGVITDTERNTFNLNDNNLKNAVSSYFGKRPENAYVRSPTPWGDLYKTYGWTQVTRTLKPKNGKILKISSQPSVVLKQVFENHSSIPATFNAGISQEVMNTVSSSWSKGGELSVGQSISYGFDIEIFNFGGETSFSYTSSWGQNTEKSKTVTVGATSAMEVTLQPGQAVLAQLHATRANIQIQMEYEASLSGHSAVRYDHKYKQHMCWCLNINDLMKSAKLSNQKVSREIIDIGFYSNSKVTVYDEESRNKLMEVAF